MLLTRGKWGSNNTSVLIINKQVSYFVSIISQHLIKLPKARDKSSNEL